MRIKIMKNNNLCMFNQELLNSYASHSVSASERVMVEQHLSQCALCRREVSRMEQTWLALDVWQEDVESAAPRLNDLRLRLNAVRTKPTLIEKLRNALEACIAPVRMMPVTPALAVIVTGLLAYAGMYNNSTNGNSTLTQPMTVSTTPSVNYAAPASHIGIENEPVASLTQVRDWDALTMKRNSNVLIRMATDGLNYARTVNFGFSSPSNDIFANYQPINNINPTTARMMTGERIRLE